MRIRAAVISVFKATDENNSFDDEPIAEIVFRQPYHNLGLAFTFHLTKSYVAPFGTCDLEIRNVSNEISEAFAFDRVNYTYRPLVQIRAGYTDTYILDKGELQSLKNTLDLVYSGFPYYVVDSKIVGGRTLKVNLSDVSTSYMHGVHSRAVEEYRTGMPIIDVIKDLLGKIEGLQYDVTELEASPEFAAKTLPNNAFYNNLPIIATIIPNLGREFGFYFTVDATGKYVFRPSKQTVDAGGGTIVSAETGMIEHPAKVNWTHYNVKTLFGLPKVFYPGEWMTIKSRFLNRSTITESETVTGVVINADYSWNDETATATYVIAPEGVPVSIEPIVEF